jgi:hypothetical protein
VSSPVVHVLSKALPQRCQYRNLSEILSTYSAAHPRFDGWLRRVLLCGLGGFYPHCRERPSAELRARLYEGYFATGGAAWVAWLRAHTFLVFFALKEALCVLVRLEPALHAVLRGVYYWDVFEKTARDAMDVVRQLFTTNTRLGRAPFCGARTELVRINAAQLRFMYKAPRRDFVTFAYKAAQGVRQRAYEAWLARHARARRALPVEGLRGLFRCPAAVERLVRDVAAHGHRRPDVPVAAWLRLCGLDAADAALWGDLKRAFLGSDVSVHAARDRLEALSAEAFCVLNYYCRCRYDLQSVALIDLPAAYYRAQARALARRQHDGVYYACRACKQFKGWAVRPGARDSLVRAMGFERVMVDPASGEVFCARKPAKTAPPPPLCPPGASVVQCNHTARSWRRRDEFEACAAFPLLRLPMLGKLLQCYNKLYCLCQRCGRPSLFRQDRFTAEGFCCGACGDDAVRASRPACFYCGAAPPGDPRRAGWCRAAMAAEGAREVLLCPRHALPVVRHVAKRWTAAELQTTLERALSARPPRTRQALRRLEAK